MTDDNNNTGYQNTGYQNTGNRNTGYQNTGNWNTGNRNTGYRNTGSLNTGDLNTGDWNTGSLNTGDLNTGDWNTGSLNTGYFNTTTPDTITVFNQPCRVDDWDNAEKPTWIYEPSPTSWIYEAYMTDAEKKDNPTFHTCGGYLRQNDWLEEWRKAYESADDEEVQAVRDLPNFDYDVFEEITGLDLRHSDTPKCNGKVVEIDGVKYELKKISE